MIGDNEATTLADIESALNAKMPIVVLSGSTLSNTINTHLQKRDGGTKTQDQFKIGGSRDEILNRLYNYSRVVSSKESSEDIASIVHLLLTISI